MLMTMVAMLITMVTNHAYHHGHHHQGMMKKYGYLEVAMGISEEELDQSDNMVDKRTLKNA